METNVMGNDTVNVVVRERFFTRNKQVLTGLGIGLLIGLVGNGVQYLLERNRREAIMKQMKIGLSAVNHMRSGAPGPLVVEGETIDTANFIVNNTTDLHRVIHDFVLSGKLSEREHDNWMAILTALTKIAQDVQIQEKVARDDDRKNDNK